MIVGTMPYHLNVPNSTLFCKFLSMLRDEYGVKEMVPEWILNVEEMKRNDHDHESITAEVLSESLSASTIKELIEEGYVPRGSKGIISFVIETYHDRDQNHEESAARSCASSVSDSASVAAAYHASKRSRTSNKSRNLSKTVDYLVANACYK